MTSDPARITAPIRAAEVPYFSGRAWLLPELLAWLEQPKERVFLLTGGPGSGTSMLIQLRVPGALAGLRRLLEHIQGRPTPREAAGIPQMWRSKTARRTRLSEAVEAGIVELQVGR